MDKSGSALDPAVKNLPELRAIKGGLLDYTRNRGGWVALTGNYSVLSGRVTAGERMGIIDPD